MPLSPLRVSKCSAFTSAGRIASSGTPPRSQIRSAQECGFSAMMTEHHTSSPPCSIAREAAGRLLDDYAAVARGGGATCPCNAAQMVAAYSGYHMLLGTTGHTFYPRMRGSAVTSTNTTGAGGMLPGEYLCAWRTGRMNHRWSRKTPKQAGALDCCRTSPSGVTTIQSKPPYSTRTQAQNPVPSNTTTCP